MSNPALAIPQLGTPSSLAHLGGGGEALPPTSILRRMLDALLDPAQAIEDPGARRTARLVSSLSLTLSLTAALVTVAYQTTNPNGVPLGTVILGAGTASLLTTYALSRTTRVDAAAVALVVTNAMIPPAMFLAGARIDHEAAVCSAAWSALSILLASTVLPWRQLLTVATAAVLALAVCFLAGTTEAGVVLHPMLLLCTLTSAVLIGNRHLWGLERLRQSELEERNPELETLRAVLEDRVEARTTELAVAYAELQANHAGLISAERMAAIGRLTAGVAHEMSSPLCAAQCSVAELQHLVAEQERSIADPAVTADDRREIVTEMREALALASTGVERAITFIRGIKSHTRDRSGSLAVPFDAVAAVRDSLALLAHVARAGQCKIDFQAEQDRAVVVGAGDRLMQVVTNVVSNSLDATADRGGGTVRVRTSLRGDQLVIEITDQGGGIPADVAPLIFEPLFTTKPSGKSTGLGLSIALDIMTNEFEGRIEVGSEAGVGSTFTLVLPAKRKE